MTDTAADEFDERWLVPDLEDPDRSEFWRRCNEERLEVQRCDECDRLRFPPRPTCPWCHSVAATWTELSGRGRVWSHVTVHPPLQPVFAEQAPYNVIVVETDDDPSIRFVGNLVTGPTGPLGEVDPASIEIGEPVELVFQRLASDVALPRWRRSPGS